MVDHAPEFHGANLESQATLEAKAAATSGPVRKYGGRSLYPVPIGCTLIGLLPQSGCTHNWHLTSDQVARIFENLPLLFKQSRILLSRLCYQAGVDRCSICRCFQTSIYIYIYVYVYIYTYIYIYIYTYIYIYIYTYIYIYIYIYT